MVLKSNSAICKMNEGRKEHHPISSFEKKCVAVFQKKLLLTLWLKFEVQQFI